MKNSRLKATGMLTTAIILVAIAIIIPAMMICHDPKGQSRKEIISEKNRTVRFQEVETFVFHYALGESQQAVVYEDTKTGVRYLYLWRGMANGGPTMTRLWDK